MDINQDLPDLKTLRKYLRIIQIFNEIQLKSGEYAAFLGKEYYIQNTIHECKHRKIKRVSRMTVYRALQLEPVIVSIKNKLDCDGDD